LELTASIRVNGDHIFLKIYGRASANNNVLFQYAWNLAKMNYFSLCSTILLKKKLS